MEFCIRKRNRIILTTGACLCASMMLGLPSGAVAYGAQAGSAQAPAAARPVGTIKAISGKSITLTTDAGSEVKIVVQDAARLLRVEPGQKDLKEAAPLQLQELLPGDRILVRGQLADDGKTVLAVSVIAMKRADIAQKQAQERDEWQKHGIGGLVSGLDAGAGTITVSLTTLGEKKEVAVHVSKDTLLRRYAPDSVKFDDAKPAPLEQIKAGDQLRARGTRSADGSELTAVEVVSGTFRNIAGTVSSIDAAGNSITVQDLATKKNVTVKISGDSLVRKLPLPMAQRIAARLKGTPANAAASGAAGGAGSASNANASTSPGSAGTGASGFGGAGRNGGGGGDLQQALSRMPAATLADFEKGDAVMIVATEGGPNGVPSVITLLGGVEPILEASPNSSASSILSPWSLGAAPGGEAGNP
ncbi:MAG TPA: DUF5666 domain-containing protein [Candidatus Angelobacter sp.]|nr:DUF5666 domain-containing protein [Candidatus Angelobacter sp.]